jgi:multiple sugar transport system ATP-binding protein
LATVKLVNLKKAYNNRIEVISDINLEIRDKEFTVLVGPSGSGKSTILRMIAGLEEITGGEIYIGETRANDILPKDRDIAMVFQDYALYPHMSVFDNIAFGLKMRKIPKDEINRRVTHTAKILGIQELLQRKPKQISGGEKQRVALGRAIVRNPKVFLMDEPLSNLDAKLRVQMRMEILRLYRKLNATVIYVTHDQTEAMTMGTRIVVLKDGAIQQIDTPRELYSHPANIFVASFIGTPSINFIRGKITQEDNSIRIRWSEGCIDLPHDKGTRAILKGFSGMEVILGIRPEHIRLISNGNITGYSLAGEIEIIENLGAESCISVITSCGNILIKLPADTGVLRGEHVHLKFDPERIHLYDVESGKNIFNGEMPVIAGKQLN